MNKHFRKVLTVLKTKAKALGFSRSELKSVAAKIADNLDLEENASDEDVDSAIDEAVDDAMEFLNVSQSAAQRAISNYKKKHNVSDEDDDDDVDENDDDDDQTHSQKNGKHQQKSGNKKTNKSSDEDDDEDDTPAWAKKLTDSMAQLAERVSSVERGNTSKSRRAKLEEALKDTGKFGERRLKEFDRIKDTFKSDDDFDDYLDEVTEDLEAYNQERADEGLSKLGVPGAAAPGKKTETDSDEEEGKPLSDKEIEALANQF